MMAFISAIYRVQTVGLNPLELILLGTMLEGAAFLFEIPTGIVADLYSRRASVIIGYLVIGAGFVLEGALAWFPTVLLAQAVWGIGYTFISGAQDAWLADEIGEAQLGQTYLRGAQMARVAGLVGLAASVGLGRVALHLPILIGGLLIMGLGIFLWLFMPETGFNPTPQPERNTWQKMSFTFRDGLSVVRGSSVLLLILGIEAVYGLTSEGPDRLQEAHFLENFSFPEWGGLDVVIWFGLLRVAQMVLGLVITAVIQRNVDVDQEKTAVYLQYAFNSLMAVGLIGFGVTSRLGIALAMVLMYRSIRDTNDPIFTAWLSKKIEPRVRATVLSMGSQVNALGQVIGGPIIGVVGVAYGLPTAFVVVGVALAPIVLLFGLTLRRTDNR